MLKLADRRKREQSGGQRLSGITPFHFGRRVSSCSGRVWLTLVTAALLSICLPTNLQLQRYSLRVGDVIPRDIAVSTTLLSVRSPERQTPPAFVEDRQASIDALQSLARAIEALEQLRAEPPAAGPFPGSLTAERPAAGPGSPRRANGVSSPKEAWSALSGVPANLTQQLTQAPDPEFQDVARLAPVILTLELAQRPISARPGDTDLARRDLYSRAAMLTRSVEIGREAASLGGAFVRPTIVEVSPTLPTLNTTFDAGGGRLIRPGQFLAHRGQIATPALIHELSSLGMLSSQSGPLWLLSLVALAIGSLVLVLVFIRLYRPGLYEDTRKLSLLAFIVLTGVAALRFLGYALGLHFSPEQFGFFALMWVTATAMLVAVLVSPEVAILVSALLSMHTAILLDNHLQFGVACLFSALAGVYSVHRIRRRAQLLRTVAILAAVNVGSACVLTVWNTPSGAPELKIELGFAVVWALVSGFMAPVLFFMGVALLERLFHVTTDLSLLELCDSHQPLLQRLALEAPGTYVHSLAVASLSEAAAQAIGAEMLWVRAGALYHDIGKIVRPHFFAENQQGENLHDKLTPTLSSKVIRAHVSDGVELAREHRLPELMIDFIQQHHGSSLVTYFYHQAIVNSGAPSGISEDSFRYPGPLPQTREAGILMLADTVESSVRSMIGRNPGRVEAIVHRVVQNRLADGQLSQCDLTLREIDQIEIAFARVLSALHHGRVDYPAFRPTEERRVLRVGAGR